MRRLLRVFRFFSRCLDDSTPPEAPIGVRLTWLAPHDAVECSRDPALDLRERGIAASFARGDRCVAAFVEGRLVGYCWLAFSPLPHLDGVWVRFDPRAAWVYKSFILASHRGRRIAPALYRFADRACRDRGRESSLICVEAHNRASVRASLNAGYDPAGYAAYLRPAPALGAWRSSAARRWSIAFFRP